VQPIGRPDSTEADPYYHKYIQLVPGDDPTEVLERQIEDAMAFLERISESQSLIQYAPGKWTVREVLNHLTDTERIFAYRSLWIARGMTEALPSLDQTVLSDGAEANHILWAEHVAEFRVVRLATIALFAHMPQSAWTRVGVASGKNVSVRALAFIIAGHTSHHLEIVNSRYVANAAL
jgi:hypothetical protein